MKRFPSIVQTRQIYYYIYILCVQENGYDKNEDFGNPVNGIQLPSAATLYHKGNEYFKTYNSLLLGCWWEMTHKLLIPDSVATSKKV